MRLARRCWQPRPAARVSVPRHASWRSSGPHSRLGIVAAGPTTKSGAPLSLNDILTFETDMPGMLIQEQLPERRADELVDRAARVLREVNTMLVSEEADQQQQQQTRGGGGGGSSTATIAPPPTSSSDSTSEFGRALFGGTAQVSERDASRTRQALQKTLEALPGVRTSGDPEPSADPGPSGGEGGAGPASSGAAMEAAAAAKQRPSWAQDLFSSAAAPASPSSSPPSPTSSGQGGSGASGSASSGPGPSSSSSGSGSAFSRPTGGPEMPPQLQPSRSRLAAWAPLAYAETDLTLPTELTLKSEESFFASKAVLPPLQSVVDLTGAARPPSRGLDLEGAEAGTVSDTVAVSEDEVAQLSALGRKLADGAGRLADGTRFEKISGVDRGPDGYEKKWEVLRGVTGDGNVQWEECWWTASNRFGLRELGAFKKGTAESGATWVEEWKELLHPHATNHRLVIERTAHKWSRDENQDEWEEKWGENYEEAGRVHKFADKWAKAGNNVWHERWGEDYDGRGACQKYTDKWAERLLPGGGSEQWGDKWTETFGDGKGTKHGEVWSGDSGGGRYNRWWNEEHYGDGRVRRYGNSTSGEYWDAIEYMDTYYNPVPHFGFGHAVAHSPTLWAVPLPLPEEGTGSEDDDGLGVGLGRL